MWKVWEDKPSWEEAEKRSTRTVASDPAMRAIFDDPCNLVIAFVSSRPNARLFAVQLEYGHFPPRSKFNAAFHLGIMTWLEMEWMVVAVPMGARTVVEQVAAELGLCLADGFPCCFDGSGTVRRFPYCGDNVYTLETVHDGGPSVRVFGQPGDSLEEELRIETVIANWHEAHDKPA